MKKGLTITGIVLAVIVLLMALLPYAFKGKIKEIAVTEGNKMLNAQFDFDEVNISLFRNFPKASVTLSDFWLKGIGEFENDTLAKVGELTAVVDVMSLFGDSGFDISKIYVGNAKLKAIVLEDGKANWDVMKESAEAEEEVETEEGASLRVKLQNLTLSDIHISYDDRQGGMYAGVSDLNATCAGDLSADHTTLKLEASVKELNFTMGAVPFLSKVYVKTRMDVDADLANSRFTLKDNLFQLNEIKASVDGWVAMLDNGAMDMDIKLGTQDVNFKDILSLIPAIYANDFKNIKTDGNVSLKAEAKGVMQGDTLPGFLAELNVKDGSFRYPDLPAGIDQIQIYAGVKNPGGSADLTEVTVNPFSFRMAGNPFALHAEVKTPVSDPDFTASATGMLNLGMVKDIYPLEDMELNGTINANLNIGGRMSYLEKEQYDKFSASGTLTLNDMLVKMEDIPNLNIKKSTFTFSPRYLNLSETTVHIGENDITADCRFENYMAFALKGETLKGNLNVRSNLFNLNDFMGGEEVEAEETDTTAMSVITIPKNIDFNMDANMKKVLFDKMQFNNINGKLIVHDGKVDMKNLSLETMGGSVVMNGAYSTADNPKSPELNASFNMSNLVFAETYKELDVVRKLAPIFENLKGSFSGSMQINTSLDEQMSPNLDALQGKGALSTKGLNLSGVAVIDQVADALSKPELKDLTVKDMNLDFIIKDGRLQTQPFDIRLKETVLNLSGTTGLDQTIDYTGKITLPASTGLSKLTTVDLKIGGTFTSPKVSIDTKSMVNQAVDVITDAAKDKALDEIGKKLGIDISDAEKQKEALVAGAKSAGEKLVQEAQKQADALVEKAGSNALKKIAAQKAGEALVQEAQKQADKLLKEAEQKGDELIEKAKKGEE